MAGINNEYLNEHKLFRIRNKKVAIAFAVFAVIVVILVFWWLKLVGVTITGDAFCGMQEHTHSDECYSCIYDGVRTQTDADNETHVHSDECYGNLICELTEHLHTARCFPDVNADVETAEDWENTLKDVVITDSVSQNIINIAMTQVGYTESERNFELDTSGNKNGYTRYGEWYGSVYGNWNAMFVSFCLDYAQAQNADTLIGTSAANMSRKWEEAGFYANADSYTAKKGDVVFLDTDCDGEVDFTGVVSEVSQQQIKVIAGDSNNAVEELCISDYSMITGYGLTEKLVREQEETGQDGTDEQTTAKQDVTQSASEKSEESEVIINSDEMTSEELWEYEKSQYISSLDSEYLISLEKLSEYEYYEVTETLYLIETLPTLDEFFEVLDLYYENGDEEGETEYYLEVQENMTKSYAHYQGLGSLQELIFNSDKMFEIKDYYSNFSTQQLTTGTSSPLTFNYVNRGWSSILPVVIYGGNANEVISTGSYPNSFWHGIVVEYNAADDYYYVSEKYEGSSTPFDDTEIESLEATTSKGFVVFVWTADTGATTLQQKNAAIAEAVTVGDRVLVSVDPTTLSKGYSSSGYGTLTFYEYVAPTVETEEDLDWYTETDEPSDSQVVDGGGKVTSADGKIITTKTINGTSEENIFDITLTVQTQSDIQIFLSEPDMAVVVVMDVSNTMNSTFTDDTVSRYDAAVEAANQFIDQFTEATDGLSQLGVVAFNTDAHEIVELQPCSTTAQSTAIKNEMASETDTIVSESGYYESDERFTNIEGGLKRAYDMLAESGNSHQYIILLTDGFPTTYLKDNSDGSTNYEGYYTTLGSSAGSPGEDGVFYDYLTGYYCSGTSYSDKAAIRAREMATKIKSSGAKVFSIGVDVAGQTIAGHERNGLSIIERTSSTYEIGGANDLNAYKNWLGNSVGSGYYYDSVNQTDITNAFANIFDEIVELNKTETKTIWTATDPMPVYDEEPSVVGFIHFYDKDGNVVAAPDDPESITGAHEEKAENTAYHEGNTIHWDLKKSGYTTFTDENDDSITYYLYTLKYRVRLVNEKDTAEPFSEDKIYETNGEAYLEYRNVTEVNGVQNISDLRNVSFSKPSVQGYLAGFDFIKQNDLGVVLPGAEFTLSHDDENCTECHGDSTALTDNEAHEDNYTAEHAVHSIGPYVASSDENGTVSFSNIPSGHVYTLTETVIPDGYMLSGSTYSVDVAYDVLTVTETLPDGTKKVWTGDGNVISNIMEVFLLPETGGTGTLPFTIIGVALMALPILYSIIRRKRERRFKLTGAEHDMV